MLYKSDSYNEEVSPKRRLDDVIHLAELCIEVLQQNEEHHAEVSVNHHGNWNVYCMDFHGNQCLFSECFPLMSVSCFHV